MAARHRARVRSVGAARGRRVRLGRLPAALRRVGAAGAHRRRRLDRRGAADDDAASWGCCRWTTARSSRSRSTRRCSSSRRSSASARRSSSASRQLSMRFACRRQPRHAGALDGHPRHRPDARVAGRRPDRARHGAAGAVGAARRQSREPARTDLGVDRAGLSLFRIAPILNGYTPSDRWRSTRRSKSALGRTPGVVSVSGATLRLLDGCQQRRQHDRQRVHRRSRRRHQRPYDQRRPALLLHAGHSAGRRAATFTEDDTADTRRSAIVNQAFVRKFRLGEAPRRADRHHRGPAAGHRNRRRRGRRAPIAARARRRRRSSSARIARPAAPCCRSTCARPRARPGRTDGVDPAFVTASTPTCRSTTSDDGRTVRREHHATSVSR